MTTTTNFLYLEDPITICSQVLMYALLFTLILGIFHCKVIAVQMIVQVQLVFYSLLTIKNSTPSFNGLASMKFIGGFYVNNLNTINTTPQSYQNIGLSQDFLDNFNIMLITLLLPLVIAGILFGISKFAKTIMMNAKLQKIAIECMCETMLYFSIFNLSKITISLIVNIQFYFGSLGGLVFGVFVLLIVVAEFVVFRIFRSHYKEFNQEYQQDIKSRIHIYLLVLKTFLCVLFLSLDNLMEYSIYVVLGIQLMFFAYSAVVKSYLALIHYIREISNGVLSFIALIIIAYAGQSTKDSINIPDNVNYLPIGILILMFVLLIINLALISKHIILQYTDWFAQSKQYDYTQQIVENKKYQKPKRQPLVPISQTQQTPNQLSKMVENDPIKIQQLQMMETLKQYSQYQSTNKKPLMSLGTLPAASREKTPQQIDDMIKKLEDLNLNFD